MDFLMEHSEGILRKTERLQESSISQGFIKVLEHWLGTTRGGIQRAREPAGSDARRTRPNPRPDL